MKGPIRQLVEVHIELPASDRQLKLHVVVLESQPHATDVDAAWHHAIGRAVVELNSSRGFDCRACQRGREDGIRPDKVYKLQPEEDCKHSQQYPTNSVPERGGSA